MYSLITIGPVRFSTYGVSLLIATAVWWWWSERRAAGRLPEWFLPTIMGAAWVGGRSGAILMHPTNIPDMLLQLVSVRVLEFSWWFACAAALLTWRICARRIALPNDFSVIQTFPPLFIAYAIASVGATIGGVSVGTPTALPWGIDVYGQLRHPVGIYDALIMGAGALWLIRRERLQLPNGWVGIAVYAFSALVTGGFWMHTVVMAGGLHVVQVGALFTLIVAHERVIMHTRKHD